MFLDFLKQVKCVNPLLSGLFLHQLNETAKAKNDLIIVNLIKGINSNEYPSAVQLIWLKIVIVWQP